MERTSVSSSHIRAVGYDPESSILEVEFNDDSVYQYTGVPQGEFDAMMASDSKGKYLHARIKDRYPYSRL